MEEKKYWVALSTVPELGAKRIALLVESFGSAKKALAAPEKSLAETGLPSHALSSLLKVRNQIDPDREWRKLSALELGVITLADSDYPSLLRQIYDPPAILFYRGDLAVLDKPCIALVGARKATEYGKSAARKLAAELVRAGTVVVSGMARGIDSCAHIGALQANGTTVAVLGCGLDVCYPPENLQLREKIVRSGVILSEFPPGTQPKPQHFPMRNRIISGLSLATVVVEAAEKSGALITADCALEQGRDVFAVPGSIHSPLSRGCHRLLKDGAAMVEQAADILQYLGLAEVQVNAVPGPAGLTPLQSRILAAMEFETVHFDEIVGRCQVKAPELAAALVELELAALIKKLPGNYFLRV
jgi:DNA processing protein